MAPTSFPDALRRARDASGLSQGALGASLDEHGGKNVSAAQVSLWESGGTKPSPDNARALEEILDQHGVFTAQLGYAVEPDLYDRLGQVETEVIDLRKELRKIRRLVENVVGDTPPRGR